MSKLLINEQPLQCQPSLAAVLGSADEAIVLQQLHYWLSRTNNVQSDGHKWIYNSMADWLKQFPWIRSRSTLSNYFNDLEERGLVVTGNFNKAKFDKTKWYRINYDALTDLEQRLSENQSSNDQNLDTPSTENCTSNEQKSANGMTKNQSTYTNRLPETTQEITQKTTAADSAGAPSENPFDLIREYRINANVGDHLAKFLKAIVELGDPLVCWAIHETADGPNTSWAYLEAILNRLEKQNIKTVKDAESAKQQRRSSPKHGHQHIEEPLPDWAKKRGESKKRPGKEFFDSLFDEEPEEEKS